MKKITLFLLTVLLHLPLIAAKNDQTTVPLKVLAIGNSFSEDAVENYLYELVEAAGKKIIIGNLYIGGASVAQHEKNSRENRSVYDYRKIENKYVFSNSLNYSIADGLADEDWDYISIQQVSPNSGRYEVTMEHLPQVLAYIQNHAPKAKILWHQTWAYQHDSTHSGFANYDRSQEKMYTAILDTSKRISELKAISSVSPKW